MADHCGCGGGVMTVVVMVLAVVPRLAEGMTAPMEAMKVEETPFPIDEGDCLVRSSLNVEEQPLNESLLAYVTRSHNATLGFLPGRKPEDWDAVNFNSTGGTHNKVRGNKWTKTLITFPRLIPEGWNSFRVMADEAGKVQVTLVQGRYTTTLFTLPPPRNVPNVLLTKGRVARCSRVSPIWKVGAGKQESVVLHLPRVDIPQQMVEVSGGGWEGAAPNLTFLFAHSPETITVAANITFKISSGLEGDYVHLNVSKVAKNGGGDGNGDEVVTSGTIHITDSLVVEVVGGRGGDDSTTISTTLIRLWVSPYTMPDNVCQSGSMSSTVKYIIGFVAMVVIAALELVLLGMRRLWPKKNASRQTVENNGPVKGDGEETEMDSTGILLPSANHRLMEALADQ